MTDYGLIPMDTNGEILGSQIGIFHGISHGAPAIKSGPELYRGFFCGNIIELNGGFSIAMFGHSG